MIQDAISSILAEGVGGGTRQTILNAEQRLIGAAVMLTHLRLDSEDIICQIQQELRKLQMLLASDRSTIRAAADKVVADILDKD